MSTNENMECYGQAAASDSDMECYGQAAAASDTDMECYEDVMPYVGRRKNAAIQKVKTVLDETLTPDFLQTLKTVEGETQAAEKKYIRKLCEAFDKGNITYTLAGSQQPLDFRNINGTGLNIEVKKTDSGAMMCNDTIPAPDTCFLILYTGGKRTGYPPQYILINGDELVGDERRTKLQRQKKGLPKEKWDDGNGVKGSIHSRLNLRLSLDITNFFKV